MRRGGENKPSQTAQKKQQNCLKQGQHSSPWGHTHPTASTGTHTSPGVPQGPYVVGVELAVPGQRVEQALDVGFEDAVDHSIVCLVQVLPQSIPEVKGNFYHLFGKKNPAFCYQQNIFSSPHQWSRWRNRNPPWVPAVVAPQICVEAAVTQW